MKSTMDYQRIGAYVQSLYSESRSKGYKASDERVAKETDYKDIFYLTRMARLLPRMIT